VKHKNGKFFMRGFGLAFCLVFFAVFSLQAKVATNPSFVDADLQKLQNDIRQRYTPDELALLQSDIIDLHDSLSHSDKLLKLYLVSVWTNQRHLEQAAKLAESIEAVSIYGDLHHYYLAILWLEQNDVRRAAPLVSELMQKHSKDPDIIFLHSHFLARSENFAEAIAVLQTNLDLHQKTGKTFFQRGLLSLLIFDYKSSVNDFKSALRDLPKTEKYYRQMAYFQMGLVYLKHFGDHKKAQDCFKKGEKIDPSSTLVDELRNNLQH